MERQREMEGADRRAEIEANGSMTTPADSDRATEGNRRERRVQHKESCTLGN